MVEIQLRSDRRAQAQLAVHLLALKPGRSVSTRKPVHLAVQSRPHDRDVGDVAVGDPALHAVEHEAAVRALRAGAHAGGVRAEVRFGEAEAADRLAARHPRQPVRL